MAVMDDAGSARSRAAQAGWRAELRKLGAADPRLLADLARAGWELALARRRMLRRPLRELLADEEIAAAPTLTPDDTAAAALVARVAFAVPAMGRRVPWRADCLVQALAARRWLAQRGIPTRLRIGATREVPQGFAAHAWLLAGETLVTGGETDGYAELI
jgi:hypothetical protein